MVQINVKLPHPVGGTMHLFCGALVRSVKSCGDILERNDSTDSQSLLKQEAQVLVPPNNANGSIINNSPTYQQPIEARRINDVEEHLIIKVVKTNQRYDKNNKVPTYSTSGKNRGKVLMINNVMFKNDTENRTSRKGADIDEQNVKELFQQMGFDVQSSRNLKKEEMVSQLRNYTKNKDLKNYDINVVIIMSHGFGDSRGSTDISGTDNHLLPTSQVIEMFDSQQCPNLNNIPKIFIFQCCRGSKKLYETEHDAIPFTIQNIQRDLLIAYSTIPGYVSNRHPRLGTWYIQAICKVFMEHAHDTDVEGLLKIVEAKLNVLAEGTGYAQTSSYENRGFKTCYLHPQ